MSQYPESPLAPDALWLAAEVTFDKRSDSATSTANPALSCKLDIVRTSDGKARVTWEMTGAVAASLHPLGFKKGAAVPAKGSKEIDFDGYIRVTLKVKDAAGNDVDCAVVLHSRDFVLDEPTGFGPRATYTT